MNVRSLNIAPRAHICFGVIVCFVITLGLFAYLQLGNIRTSEQDIESIDWH